MRVGAIRERLLRRIGDILRDGNLDDALLVADQLRVVASALAGLSPDDEVDLSQITVDTAQASRMLSYHAEHVRRLIRQGSIQATKAGADYRIPLAELFQILVRRHNDSPLPALLPEIEPAGLVAGALGADVELAIDLSVVRRGDRQGIHLQRINLDLADVTRSLPRIIAGHGSSPSASS